MTFEGSEKKVEIIVKNTLNLREQGYEFWAEMVSKCEATILSTISNSECDAYLLSESSLFVWENRFLMITCGTTILANSVTTFIEKMGKDVVDALFYQRKNEYFERLQASSFFEDVEKINDLIPGKALRFGHLDSHHNYLFYSDKINGVDEDTTTELLMYHITGKAVDIFRKKNQDINVIRDFLNYEETFNGFQIDDFLFEPHGFSLNGIKDDKYITIHITPEFGTSYVSFETNLNMRDSKLLDKILALFKPEAFDIVDHYAGLAPELEDQNLACIKKYRHEIADSLNINYFEFHKIQEAMNEAIEVKL